MKRRDFIEKGALSTLLALTSVKNIKGLKSTSPGILETEREIPVMGEYDVIVCGAGPAGVSAVIEAGRNGAKTLLIEAHGCLGGVWTAGLLTWILDQADKPGFMREIENDLLKRGGVSREIDTGKILSFDPEAMKLLLEELCLDAGIEILLHTRVVASVKDRKNRLTHIITESKSGREAWKGNVFIDSTGDGDLSALSGCRFDLGRESDGAVQPFSLLALVTGINFNEIREFSRWVGDTGSTSKKKLLEEIKRGGINPSYLSPGLYPIRKDLFKLMANHEYGFSPVKSIEVTKATLHARREVNSIVKALQSVGGIWKNLRLVATAEQIGTREGRRIHGLYTLTKDDLIRGARFTDAVCRVTFGVDIHSVSKQDEQNRVSYSQGVKSKDYDIPLRSLIAKDAGGLIMAGRCISGDVIAYSSYRVTGNAVTMGQAAGRVAAISSKKNIFPQEVNYQSLNLQNI